MKDMSRRLLAISVGFFVLASAALPLKAKSDAEQVCVSVGRLLEEGHYTHQPLNDDASRKLLQSYLELLDFSHLFFTQGDIDALNALWAVLVARSPNQSNEASLDSSPKEESSDGTTEGPITQATRAESGARGKSSADCAGVRGAATGIGRPSSGGARPGSGGTGKRNGRRR